ncbi:hypothetical protein SMICM17S_10663 [Streptomyces microflavus]
MARLASTAERSSSSSTRQQPVRLGQQPPVLADRPPLEGGDRDDRQRPGGLPRRYGEEIGNGPCYLLQRLEPGTRLVAQQQPQEQPDLAARTGAEGVLVEHLPQGGGDLRTGAGVQRDAGQLQSEPVADDGGGAAAQGVEVAVRGRTGVPAPGGAVRRRLQTSHRLGAVAGAPVVLGDPDQREGGCVG